MAINRNDNNGVRTRRNVRVATGLLTLLLLTAPLAIADQVWNDVTATSPKLTIDAGQSTNLGFYIKGVANDGEPGCNAIPSSPANVTFNVPAGVTASPKWLIFTQCHSTKTVSFTSSTPGSYKITVSVFDNGPGSYTVENAAFTLTVNARDSQAPTVTPPDDITVEATGPSGATVYYGAATISDNVGVRTDFGCNGPNGLASGSMFPLGNTRITCQADDAAGNVGTAAFSVTVQDTTAPVFPALANHRVMATSAAGTAFSFDMPVAMDIVDLDVTSTCTGPEGWIFPLGTSTITCNATDVAGNSENATFQVTVEWSRTGALQPINSDGSSTFKLGSTIPVKFRMTGESVGASDASAMVYFVKQSSSSVAPNVPVLHTAADVGHAFRYDEANDQYIFNLSTKGYSAGTYLVVIQYGDNTASWVRVTSK